MNLLPKPKKSLLPLLTVLFLISYGLMASLVVEQARTIDQQRYLIRSLFSDSSQLSAMKGKAFQKQRADEKAAAEQQAQNPPVTPPTKDQTKRDHSAEKLKKALPRRPPSLASDEVDERRILISI